MYATYPRRLVGLVLMTFGLFLATASLGEEIAKEGMFEGEWSLKGSARSIDTEGSKELKVFRVEGPVKVHSSGGLATEFEALCVGVSNNETGGVGRCAWTDENGDKILIELSGTIFLPGGSVREARGAVIGGTGRYEGVEGDFKVDWIFVESALDDSKFKGYVTKLKGNWKRP